MQLTRRNHYNPCFWTAHWNPHYFEEVRRGAQDKEDPRKQTVFVLNVKSNKITEQAVENVHFDKGLGVAEIMAEDAKSFCKRRFPDEYERFCQSIEANPETRYLDFENILTTMENASKAILLAVIRKGRIDTLKEKGELTAFVPTHNLRSHAMMQSMVELTDMAGLPKFEYFWMLKRFFGNVNLLFPYSMTMMSGHWRFHRLNEDTLPLTDTPVLLQPGSLMLALSPRLLLEIDRTDRSNEEGWRSVNHIDSAKLDEFRRRTIGNTFREIIFGDRKLLEQWQRTPEFVERHRLMASTSTYNAKVADFLNGSVWQVNAHGNACT